MSVTIVIPSRLGSTRIPEKALADICGKPMIQHVYERAMEVKGVDEVLVATDHQRIYEVVESFGGKAVMTPSDLASGTDRVAYVAKMRTKKLAPRVIGHKATNDIYINVQGDEPLLDPQAVEASLKLVQAGRFPMATPAAALKDHESLKNPNVVKVLIAADGRAVYFSRFPIPYSRQPAPNAVEDLAVRHHLGIYVYTLETLLHFASLPKSPWEAAESLEQLRALYHGIPIGITYAEKISIGVDTAEDLEAVRRILNVT